MGWAASSTGRSACTSLRRLGRPAHDGRGRRPAATGRLDRGGGRLPDRDARCPRAGRCMGAATRSGRRGRGDGGDAARRTDRTGHVPEPCAHVAPPNARSGRGAGRPRCRGGARRLCLARHGRRRAAGTHLPVGRPGERVCQPGVRASLAAVEPTPAGSVAAETAVASAAPSAAPIAPPTPAPTAKPKPTTRPATRADADAHPDPEAHPETDAQADPETHAQADADTTVGRPDLGLATCGDPGVTIQFTADAMPGATYDWDFDDGGGNGRVVSHQFSPPGTYHVDPHRHPIWRHARRCGGDQCSRASRFRRLSTLTLVGGVRGRDVARRPSSPPIRSRSTTRSRSR